MVYFDVITIQMAYDIIISNVITSRVVKKQYTKIHILVVLILTSKTRSLAITAF